MCPRLVCDTTPKTLPWGCTPLCTCPPPKTGGMKRAASHNRITAKRTTGRIASSKVGTGTTPNLALSATSVYWHLGHNCQRRNSGLLKGSRVPGGRPGTEEERSTDEWASALEEAAPPVGIARNSDSDAHSDGPGTAQGAPEPDFPAGRTEIQAVQPFVDAQGLRQPPRPPCQVAQAGCTAAAFHQR